MTDDVDPSDPSVIIAGPQLKVTMRIAQMEFGAEGENDQVFKAFGLYLAMVSSAFNASNAAVSALQAQHKDTTSH